MNLDVNDESLRVRYLTGQLSAEQTRLFEEHLMEDPDLLEQLQTTQAFLDAVEHRPFDDSRGAGSQNVSGLLRRPIVSFPLGVVTGLAATAMLTLGVFTYEPADVYSSANLVFLEASRGVSASETEVFLDENNRSTVFIQTSDMQPTTYSMELITADSGDLIMAEEVTANAAGELVLVLQFPDWTEQSVELVLTNAEKNEQDVLKLKVVRSSL